MALPPQEPPPPGEFDDTAHRAWHEAVAIQVDTAGEITRQLRMTLMRIDELLAGQPTDWQSWYLPQLRRQVADRLAEFGREAGAVASDGAEAIWGKGVEVVDAPLATGGVHLEALAPRLDRGQLVAMQSFLTGKMRDVAMDGANRINTALGLVVTGLNTPDEAATAIKGILGGKTRRRALTVVRTELGRAFSTAAHGRMKQASQAGLKGLKKQWRRSGKIHSRRTHDLADGQVRDVDEPFLVGGEKLMYPRDPDGSAANTINCGCTQLPYMAHWDVLHPGNVPYAPEEIGADRAKRDIADVRASGFRQWAGEIIDHQDATRAARAAGQRPPAPLATHGDWQAVGVLSPRLVSFLRAKGIEPTTMEIAVGDKQLARLRRTGSRGKETVMLPKDAILALPDHLVRPKAVFWGMHDNALHFIFDVPGEARLGNVVVRPRARDDRARHRNHNFVVSGGLTPASAFADDKVYEPIPGAP